MQKISIINDEISDNLKETIKFLKQHNVKSIELRSVNKKNLINLSFQKIKKISRILNKNRIGVSCLSSPLFKWEFDKKVLDKRGGLNVNNFYFNENKVKIEKVFRIADILNSRYIRIFSFLKYNSFKLEDIDKKIQKIIELAEKYDKILLIENEPVCNVDSLEKLLEFVCRYKTDRIKILLDPGNLYYINLKLDFCIFKKLIPYIDYLHIKDYSFVDREYKIFGQGNINYERIFTLLKNKSIYYSVETHSKGNRYKNSSESIRALKKTLNSKRIKYGIVGCGRVSSKHAIAIKENNNSELVGVYDIDNKKKKKISEEFHCEAFGTLDQLIKDVDVVNICTPHDTHIDIIKKVIKKNKKCLCEKPGGIQVRKAFKVNETIKGKNNVFVVYQNRFNDPIVKMWKVLEKKQMGRLLYVFGNVRWCRDLKYYNSNWQGKKDREGGILFNQGIHLIDFLMTFFDKNKKTKILNVYKDKIYHKKIETEDIFLSQFKNNNTIYNIEVSVSTLPVNLESRVLFVFEKGRIRIGGLSLNKFAHFYFNNYKQKNFTFFSDNKDVYGCGHKELIKKLSTFVSKGNLDSRLVSYGEALDRIKFIDRLYKNFDK